MFQNHQVVPNNPPQDNLPSWEKFQLKRFPRGATNSICVIIDNYLIVLVQEREFFQGTKSMHGSHKKDQKEECTITILAFNLLDHSVQEVEIDTPSMTSRQYFFNLLKYGDNQIICYCDDVIIITIESFEPLKVKCEEISGEKKFFRLCTAEIYKDCLYIYGETEDDAGNRQNNKELWSFYLKNRTWRLCETTGEDPFTIDVPPQSFIFQDNLYIYRAVGSSYMGPPPRGLRITKHLFQLNLNSMEWTKIEQEETHLESQEEDWQLRCFGTLYKDHLVTLKHPKNFPNNALCFLNLHTKNTWSTFDIGGVKENYGNRIGLMTYKNSVLSLQGCRNEQYDIILSVVIMNLSNFGISTPKSAEEEYLIGLFLSQEKSDIAFKVENQVIPAHKEILMKNSRYFAGVFNSNMAESKQDVIEINDCDPETFKKYLQFIYQEKVSLDDENQAIRLYVLADKYREEDLCEKCLYFLRSILNMENIYKILDFSHQENLSKVQIWCIELIQEKIIVENVAELISYLLFRQEDSEFKENRRAFRDFALNFVLDKFIEIYMKENGNMEIYEKFIVNNIEMETISPLALFLAREKESFVAKIKEAVFSFVQENIESLMISEIGKAFPIGFFTDFTLYLASQIPKSIKKENEICSECREFSVEKD